MASGQVTMSTATSPTQESSLRPSIDPNLPPPYSPSEATAQRAADFRDRPPNQSSEASSSSLSGRSSPVSTPMTDLSASVLSQAAEPARQRNWRPTERVPGHLTHRHQREDGDRNHWLSEDEGVHGVAASIGRRRRRGSDAGGAAVAGPSRNQAVLDRPTARTFKSDRAKLASSRPEQPSSTTTDTLIGIADPPDIEQLATRPADSHIPRLPPTMSTTDTATIAGPSQPRSPPKARDEADAHEDEARQRRRKRKEMLCQLRDLFVCGLCPSESDRLLHHPLTLPCGHTLSSEHMSIPAPPPLRISPGLPQHEVFELQQRRHHQRLNLWAGVMCPIPSCKRYSPSAAHGVHHDRAAEPAAASAQSQEHQVASPSRPRASSVQYYPSSPVIAPPAYSVDAPVTETGTPLLDITLDKIMGLVLRELGEDPPRRASEPAKLSDLTDGESDHGSISSASTLARSDSKRRKNALNEPDRHPPEVPFEKELYTLLECDVCSMLLYEPVTTPCQHSFCAKCLGRSLDHSQRCPVCRQELPSFASFQDQAMNKLLLSVLTTAFPAEYVDRRAAIERDERDSQLETPIFVCTLAFPGMPTILHVFEPRYRLMIRRCIESSSPRFGMVLPARGDRGMGGISEYGTMLEIQSVQMLPDGRSMVETVGSHRFKLLEKGNLDGYTVGKIEIIEDISAEEEAAMEAEALRASAARTAEAAAQPAPAVIHAPTPSTSSRRSSSSSAPPTPAPSSAPGSMGPPPLPASVLAAQQAVTGPSGAGNPAAAGSQPTSVPPAPQDEADRTTEEYMAICRTFIDQLRSGSAPWLKQRLDSTYGTMPTDPSELSYWMALVMPIDEYEKARLLPIRSPRLRLKLIVHWVESLRSSWWFHSGRVGQLLSLLTGRG